MIPFEPSVNTGRAEGKFVLKPWHDIPSSFLPPDVGGDMIDADAVASVLPARACQLYVISDHFLLLLPFPCDLDRAAEAGRKLIPRNVDVEQWWERNGAHERALRGSASFCGSRMGRGILINISFVKFVKL